MVDNKLGHYLQQWAIFGDMNKAHEHEILLWAQLYCSKHEILLWAQLYCSKLNSHLVVIANQSKKKLRRIKNQRNSR